MTVRILFTCNPGFGHLHPMLPLAGAARRAGDEVVIATGPDLAPRAGSYGFDVWSVGLSSDETAARYLERFPDSNDLPAQERLRLVAPRMFVDIAARSRVDALRERAADWRPDLVVYDQSEFAAPIVAALLGAPTVVHSWGPMMPGELLALVEPAVEALAAEHGVGAIIADALAKSVYVDICPPGLQLPEGPAWKRVQPMRYEDPQPGPDARVDCAIGALPRAATVYVTLGTVMNKLPGVFETMLAALEGVGVNCVVTVGPDGDPGRLGQQPAHVLVERYIPQALVLPRCRAMVAHAGAGTMLGALTHGVPQVLLPHGGEQHLNAEACRRAGAALVLRPEELDAAAIRNALMRVLHEPDFAQAALRLGDEIAAMPSPDEALAAVTDLAC
jgi:UDP:flavonoid glycosyltransferase YjiC (YdhE family)